MSLPLLGLYMISIGFHWGWPYSFIFKIKALCFWINMGFKYNRDGITRIFLRSNNAIMHPIASHFSFSWSSYDPHFVAVGSLQFPLVASPRLMNNPLLWIDYFYDCLRIFSNLHHLHEHYFLWFHPSPQRDFQKTSPQIVLLDCVKRGFICFPMGV